MNINDLSETDALATTRVVYSLLSSFTRLIDLREAAEQAKHLPELSLNDYRRVARGVLSDSKIVKRHNEREYEAAVQDDVLLELVREMRCRLSLTSPGFPTAWGGILDTDLLCSPSRGTLMNAYVFVTHHEASVRYREAVKVIDEFAKHRSAWFWTPHKHAAEWLMRLPGFGIEKRYEDSTGYMFRSQQHSSYIVSVKDQFKAQLAEHERGEAEGVVKRMFEEGLEKTKERVGM